jgi:hypothetical protein
MVDVPCKTCDQGTLNLRKVHRMTGPAVTIGYILLVPSILGILFSIGFFLVTMAGAASVVNQEKLTPATVQNLRNLQVPTGMISELQKGEHASVEAKRGLSAEQANAVSTAESEADAHMAAGGCFGACGTGMAAIMAVVSFVGGLIGWLLVMKKQVLVCSACSAVTNAS